MLPYESGSGQNTSSIVAVRDSAPSLPQSDSRLQDQQDDYGPCRSAVKITQRVDKVGVALEF
jgi:hypothetical protein